MNNASLSKHPLVHEKGNPLARFDLFRLGTASKLKLALLVFDQSGRAKAGNDTA